MVVVAACGGAGATTAVVLLAATLAPATGVLLLASGSDRGSLTTRANASGGDVDALARWTAEHRGRPLGPTVPGMAVGDAGSGRFVVAARGLDDAGRGFDADAAVSLFAATDAATDAATESSRASVLLDWSCRHPVPGRVWDSATHVLVAAPATAPGLLSAEYAVQHLEATMPAATPLSLISVDVRGRALHRAGRAALARLRALELPITSLPYDPALADDPQVHWRALRPRTRSAVSAALANLLHSDQPRKDEK